jgi:uncharacterized membrane protein YcfT
VTSKSPTAAGRRIAWLDLARAISIVLVVLYHAGAGAGFALLPPAATSAGSWWSTVNSMLVPIRMPLFFLVSGMLAVGAVNRPWRRIVRPRVADFLWPYLLWSALFAVTAWMRYAPEDPLGYVRDQAKTTVVAMGPYWFIAVLPVFFLAARLGRSRPRLLLAAAVLIYVGSWPLRQIMLEVPGVPDLVAEGLYRFTIFILWYIAGYVLRDRIIAFAQRAHPLLGLLVMGVFITAVWAIHGVDVGVLADRVLQAVATLSGLLGAVALLPPMSRKPPVARLGREIGSRTLAIYLIHPLVINAVVVLYPGSALGQALHGTVVADLLLIPVVTALAVVIAVLIHEVVDRWGPGWFFAAPGGREKSNISLPTRR